MRATSLSASLLLTLCACSPDQPPDSAVDAPVIQIAPVSSATAEPDGDGDDDDDAARPKPDKPHPVSAGRGTPCNPAEAIALQTAMHARERQALNRGMKKTGPFVCGVQAPKGMTTVRLNIEPARCYTALAHALGGVTEVDILLRPDMGPTNPMLGPLAGMVLAKDTDAGPTATLGGQPNCFKNPMPMPFPVRFEAAATHGAGPVAIQVYVD